MTQNKILPYSCQYINDEDIQSIVEVLNSGIITRGEKVVEFEQKVAELVGAEYAVAFSSGSAALVAAYFAADASVYDTLYTSPNTFASTLSMGLNFGVKPELIDIDYATGNIDLEILESKLKQPFSRGKPIVTLVHYSGVPVDVERFNQSLDNYKAVIIEDAAHALGARYLDKSMIGSCRHSDMTMFSFHPVKSITTGEGGIITTNRLDLCKKLQLYRNNGMVKDSKEVLAKDEPWYYEIDCYSGNFNFTDFQAALGVSQLQKLDSFIKKRQQLMKVYRRRLKNCPYISLPPEIYDDLSSWHLCPLKIDFEELGISRAELMKSLKEKGILTQVHYIPLYKALYSLRKQEGWEEGFPKMEQFYARELSFPLFYKLEESEVESICDYLLNINSLAPSHN
ncbi:MAG: DegT/DnrJ/EryC1/StrS family aminotransferase [Chlamydiales bacterium]|nr:DegT/DnrJ/EryC1/StrS family aminotransferase [Chlamydiales bacterium]